MSWDKNNHQTLAIDIEEMYDSQKASDLEDCDNLKKTGRVLLLYFFMQIASEKGNSRFPYDVCSDRKIKRRHPLFMATEGRDEESEGNWEKSNDRRENQF